MRELHKKDKDKVEYVKQQIQEIQKVLDYRIIPKKNHILYEINLSKKTIEIATYTAPKTTIMWHEALTMYHKVSFNKIDLNNVTTITKSEVIKQENCVYVFALNKKNVIKILERDFNIKFK